METTPAATVAAEMAPKRRVRRTVAKRVEYDEEAAATMLRLLSPQDLADLCQVPVGTVYKWNHQGTSPRALHVGKHVRYLESDVLLWLQERAS